MLSLNIHLRQDLGEWGLTAVLVEDYGAGLEPARSTAGWQAPLTAEEWDHDALSAVLSALQRWLDLTIAEQRQPRKA